MGGGGVGCIGGGNRGCGGGLGGLGGGGIGGGGGGNGSFTLGGTPSATRYCHIAIPAQKSATALQRFTRFAGASPIFDSMRTAVNAR